MSKKLLMCASLAASLFMASCSDNEQEPNTRTYSGTMPAVVIPLNQGLDPVITEMPVRITQYYDRGNSWITRVNKLDVTGFNTLAFETPELAGTDSNGNIFIKSLSNFTAETGQTVRDFNLEIYNNYYFLSMGSNGGYVPTPYGSLIACNYKVGADYSVATFPVQAYYGGVTTTYYMQGSEQKEFVNNVPMYFVNIDMAKRTAQVTIYNVKFAESMPMALSAVTLRGLKIEASRQSGYVISGDNIVPGVGIGANEVDYPQYTFDHFEMYPTNQSLTKCAISYSVAGKYNGVFTGSYPVEQ